MSLSAPITPGVLPPGRAPVTPRGRCLPGGEVLPIEDLVRPWIEAGAHGVIAIKGAPDSGRSTALQYLLATFGASEGVVFLDEPAPAEVEAHAERALVIYTTNRPAPESRLATIALAGWGDDDAIEYLLAKHRDQCASVMKRLLADAERASLLGGSPHLWTVALEEMAQDDAVRNVETALLTRLRWLMPVWAERWKFGNWALQLLRNPEPFLPEAIPGLLAHEFTRLFRHGSVQLLLAAEAVVVDLRGEVFDRALEGNVPRDVVRRVASQAGDDFAVRTALSKLLKSDWITAHPAAASFMLAIDPDWRPQDRPIPNLSRALLARACWTQVDLAAARLTGADLSEALLTGANLSESSISGAELRGAFMFGADLTKAIARQTNFAGASLELARMNGALLWLSSFEGANLWEAVLVDASLSQANLSRACLRGADLTRATLNRARLDDADLRGANLTNATARECAFRLARLQGTVFVRAELHSCDFEGADLTEPDFTGADLRGAWFTSSVLRRARFKRANLAETGLADVEWEDADLRDADFTNASFHMGSSRSGLVGSPIASEGSRTGFYTDESLEDGFRAPEDVRKANLRRADLRGAKVSGTDWYLVDLRGARYTPRQEAHFRKCRAILDDRMS